MNPSASADSNAPEPSRSGAPEEVRPLGTLALGFERVAALLGAEQRGASSLLVLFGVVLVWAVLVQVPMMVVHGVTGVWESWTITRFLVDVGGVMLYGSALHAGLRALGSRKWPAVVLLVALMRVLYSLAMSSLLYDAWSGWAWPAANTAESLLGVLALGTAFAGIRGRFAALWVALALEAMVFAFGTGLTISLMDGVSAALITRMAVPLTVHVVMGAPLVAAGVVLVRSRLAPWGDVGGAPVVPAAKVGGGGFFGPERAGIRMGLLGGMLMMGIAVVWFVVGWTLGRLFVYPPILFCIGLYATVRGMATGNLAGKS